MNTDMRVLVVDDYKTMRRILRNLLKQFGIDNVQEAADGAHALEMLKADEYDLIICDWTMEPMDGLTVLKTVRANTRLFSTPFLMITAESRTDIAVKIQEAGASGYIVKPFNSQTLKTKLEAIFDADKAGWGAQ